jgi:superfamily II DNA or RNA helicase
MDDYLQSDGEDDGDWRLATSMESRILHHVHLYGQFYKTGRMKDDDILSQAATALHSQLRQVQPVEHAVDTDQLRGVWTVHFDPDHWWVLDLHAISTDLRGKLYEWYNQALVHQSDIAVVVTREHSTVDSVTEAVMMRTIVDWCVDTSIYGLVHCTGVMRMVGAEVCCPDLQVETMKGVRVHQTGLSRHQDHLCRNCGNVHQFDVSRETQEGVVVCMQCGTCIEHNLHTGEAHRNFAGEANRNHHGKWNSLFSESYNLQTFQGEPKRRKSGPRRQSGDTYKDNQKKQAFDIIEAMSHATGHRYPLHHQCTAAPVAFPGISSLTMQAAKQLFAQRRDTGDRITHFVSIVASCIIAAYWLKEKQLAAPPASITPAVLHHHPTSKPRGGMSDEQFLWHSAVEPVRRHIDLELQARLGGCRICACFDAAEVQEAPASSAGSAAPSRGLNSHLPADHSMWGNDAPAESKPLADAVPSTVALELAKKRLPPSLLEVSISPAVRDLMALLSDTFLSNQEAYIIQYLLQHHGVQEQVAVDKEDKTGRLEYCQALVDAISSQLPPKKRQAGVRHVLVGLWRQGLLEQRQCSQRCEHCDMYGDVRWCWVLPEAETLVATMETHEKSLQSFIQPRKTVKLCALERLSALRQNLVPHAEVPRSLHTRPKVGRGSRPPMVRYRAINPNYDLYLPAGWSQQVDANRRIIYVHIATRAAQWDPPPLVPHAPGGEPLEPGPSQAPSLAPLGADWAQVVAPDGTVGFRHLPSGAWRWQPPPMWPPLPPGWRMHCEPGSGQLRYHCRATDATTPHFPVRHPVGQPMPCFPWILPADGLMVSTRFARTRPRRPPAVATDPPGTEPTFSLQHIMHARMQEWLPEQLRRRQALALHIQRMAEAAGGEAAELPPLVGQQLARLLMTVHRRVMEDVVELRQGTLLPPLLPPPAVSEEIADEDYVLPVAAMVPLLQPAERYMLLHLLQRSAVRSRGIILEAKTFSARMVQAAPDGSLLRPDRLMWQHQRQVLDCAVGPDGLCSSGIAVVPCGGGKTAIGIGLLAKVGGSCIVLCNNSTSVRQWEEEFLQWTTLDRKDICCVTSDRRLDRRPAPRVLITTYFMCMGLRHKRRKGGLLAQLLRQPWKLALLDEVHMVGAARIREVVASLQAAVLFGLTATPLREDDAFQELHHLVGPTLYTVSWAQLTAEGYLATIDNVNIVCPMDPATLALYRLERRTLRSKCISALNRHKISACAAILRYHLGQGHKVLIFFEELYVMLQYAKHLRDDKGMPLVKIESQERPELVARATRQFQAGQFRVLCISRTGDCSLNLPSANVGIQVSSHEGSRRQEAQRLGRISRKHRPGEKPQPGQDAESFFYTLVSDGTKEMKDRDHREEYLEAQGYSFPTLQWRWQPGTEDEMELEDLNESSAPQHRQRMLAILRSIQPGLIPEQELQQTLQQHFSAAAPPAAAAAAAGGGRSKRKPPETARQRLAKRLGLKKSLQR